MPPAPVGGGRLVAEGYAVEIIDTPTGRREVVETPGGVSEIGRRLPPRVLAVLVGGTLLAIAVVVTAVFKPVAGAAALVAGWFAYLVARLARKPLPLALSILYFDEDRRLTAYDDIQVGGTGLTEVALQRHIVAADKAAPAPSISAVPTPSSVSPSVTTSGR